jgi:hypothetical protein
MARFACSALACAFLVQCGPEARVLPAPPAPLPAPVDFVRDVQPLLRAHCYACHGAGRREAGLRLDSRASAMRSKAILPGRGRGSLLVQKLLDEDPEARMPLGRNPLPRAAVDLLARWIDEGAAWPDAAEMDRHWAYATPSRPAPPAVRDAAWVRSPIDAFILARLEREGLAPSPPAERETLYRRLSLDLTGLPPDPKDLDAFLADGAPGAWERAVDRLLASPHYGEHWARPWLDLARYADTDGYEKDLRRTMWRWRDWVIDALNRDMPYTQFTLEQIAGDLLPGATRDQLIATGFHRNTLFNNEGGVDQAEARHLVIVDRVNTTATVWLGATLACAQCHDHKYDPFPQRDYYRLYAFFAPGDYREVGPANVGEMRYVEPSIEAPTPEQERRRAELREAVARLGRVLATPTPELAAAQAAWERALPREPWTVLRPETAASRDGATLEILDDGSVLAGGASPAKDTHTLDVRTSLEGITLLRLEALPHDRLPAKGPGRAGNGNLVLGGIRVKDGDKELAIIASGADHEQEGFPAAHAVDASAETGWGISPRFGQSSAAYFAVAPSGARGERVLRVTLEYRSPYGHHVGGRVRLSATTVPLDAGRREGWHAAAFDAGGWAAMKLPAHFDGAVDGAVWFRREVEIPESWAGREGVLELGPVDDDDTTWFDGAEIGATRGWDTPRAYKVPALKAGRAVIVVRVVDTGGPGGVFRGPLRLRCGDDAIELGGEWRFAIGYDVRRAGRGFLPARISELAALPEEKRTPEQSAELAAHYRSVAPSLEGTRRELAGARQALAALEAEIPTALVMRDRPGAPARAPVRIRGAFTRPGEIVSPGAPAALHPLPPGPPSRLTLAKWLVSGENPLTARVHVNRVWQSIFGRGIVETPEDFGTRGAPPTHPDLLDWLATEFVRLGWSQKALIREIVTSSTYRQSSRVTREVLERDPYNRLLARGPRFRLHAEGVRDVALAAAGLLDRRIGGPPVFPPQPDGVWRLPYNGDQWMPSGGSDRHRRGLYTFLRRTAPYPSFMAFDATSREACVARRARTNTPLQALTLLNDPAFFEAARGLGRRMIAEGGGAVESRAAHGFRLCTARRPTRRELDIVAGLYRAERERFDRDPAAARQVAGDAEAAAWTMVANALLNLDETQTKE